MKRLSMFCLFALAATATVVAVVGPSSAAPTRRQQALHGGYGGGYFAIACGFSHRNNDDPIVFPGQRGLSHNHTFFGNRSTDAFSTPAWLRAAGQTSCRLRADTAAYWAPTLFVGGRAIEPLGVVAYYVRRTREAVQAFPAGLEMIAGSAAARSAQGAQITSWSCGGRFRSSTIPTCERQNLRLQVNFPNCWDGSRLDSGDHKAHMAYATDRVCPASHAVEVPGLTLVIYYGVAGGSNAELSSGGQFSAHADFVNAWNQDKLAALVDRYLNRFGRRGGGRGR
jgi:hypothetical protein